MKTTGIILIIFSGTGLGLCKSMELSGRLKILERLAQLLLLLKGEIRCTGASLEDAFLDVAKKMPGEYRLFLEEELRERIRELKSGKPKRQKMYQSMGILGGILLAVLMW